MTEKQYTAALNKALFVQESLRLKHPELPETPITDVKLWHDGNFTVAVVNHEYMGCTKRNPKDDRYNRTTGDYHAISRALKAMYSLKTT
jgi:hypothetical protein